MDLPNQWPSQTGRVEFHLKDAFSEIPSSAGGPLTFDLPTADLPPELLALGLRIGVKLNRTGGWMVEGPSLPDPFIEPRVRAGSVRRQSHTYLLNTTNAKYSSDK
jgi:hypothetical protein